MKFLKSFNVLSLALVLAGTLSSGFARADLYGELIPKEQTVLDQGKQVLRTEDVAGSVWPRITVYQRFELTPEQLTSVMFDYALQKVIYKGMIKSDPVTPGAADTDIDFELTFPKVMGITIPNEVYTMNNKLSTFGPTGYQISWTMVRASSMQECFGFVQFEQYGTGTIVRYTNFIKPPRPNLAKLIVKMAIDQVKDVVQTLGDYTNKERNETPAVLNAQMAVLAKALGK